MIGNIFHQVLKKKQSYILLFFLVFLWYTWEPAHYFPQMQNTHHTVGGLSSKPKNSCDWRPEPLQGTCDVTKPTQDSQIYKNAEECENACCANAECISFQFRTKEGCMWGGDTRLGAEKDGVGSYLIILCFLFEII